MSIKKIFYAGFVILGFPLFAHAQTPYGMAGCGLGSELLKDDSTVTQVFAGTTNATFGNQTFAISSGTSNCMTPSQKTAYNAQQNFITDNYGLLTKEIAQGGGETLKAFSNTFGCQKEIYGKFATQLQNSYSKIFANHSSESALHEIQNEIKSNPQLLKSCSLIG